MAVYPFTSSMKGKVYKLMSHAAFLLERIEDVFNLVIDVTCFYDCEPNYKLELAMSRNSWRVGAQKLMDSPQKPTIQQLRQHLKEGLAISISSKDYFRRD